MICLWHDKLPGCLGGRVYRAIIDEAKELLKTWFQKELKEEEDKSLSHSVVGRQRLKTANIGGGTALENAYNTQPRAHVFMSLQERRGRVGLRPNMFRPTIRSRDAGRGVLAIPQTISNGKQASAKAG